MPPGQLRQQHWPNPYWSPKPCNSLPPTRLEGFSRPGNLSAQNPVSPETPHSCSSLSSCYHPGCCQEEGVIPAAFLLSLEEKSQVFTFPCSSKALFSPTLPGTLTMGSSMTLSFYLRQDMFLTTSSFNFPTCSTLGARKPQDFATCLKWGGENNMKPSPVKLPLTPIFTRI